MTPAPSPPRFSWREVLQQVAAWGILAAVSGIGFIAYTVPRSLDAIQAGQKAIAERAVSVEGRVTALESDVGGIDDRVTRLEVRR